jgi:hypothetical protein
MPECRSGAVPSANWRNRYRVPPYAASESMHATRPDPVLLTAPNIDQVASPESPETLILDETRLNPIRASSRNGACDLPGEIVTHSLDAGPPHLVHCPAPCHHSKRMHCTGPVESLAFSLPSSHRKKAKAICPTRGLTA